MSVLHFRLVLSLSIHSIVMDCSEPAGAFAGPITDINYATGGQAGNGHGMTGAHGFRGGNLRTSMGVAYAEHVF